VLEDDTVMGKAVIPR